ncbi:MAG: phosphotransferase [Dehalococcoidia bacterium]|nr:phosphotransferase [Dehalococcoidia bacterium]
MKTIDIPAGPEQLSAEWLTDALRQNGIIDAPAVASFDATTIAEGSGFIGQLARVALAYDGAAPGAPDTLIAKFPGASEGGRQIGNLFRFYEREIRFYEEIAHRIEMRVPRRYHSAMDIERGRYVLLIEDLAPARVGDQLTGCSIADARLAVRELAAFHAAWWQHPELDTFGWMPMVDDPVQQLAAPSYAQAWQPFVDNFGSGLSKEVLSIAEQVGQKVVEFQTRLADEPRTIMHGDYRIDNLFFRSDAGGPEFAVADWQISSRGRGIFDVSYFIAGGLQPSLRKAREMDLLKLYHDTLRAGGVQGYSWEQCLREYRQCTLYLLVYVVISLGTLDFANERGLALFKAWLERATTAIDELHAAELL